MKLKQLTFAMLFAMGLTASAGNEKTTVTQVTEAVDVTGNTDYVITGTTPFTTTGSVNIVDTEHAVVIIKKVKPSKVLSSLMQNIYIKGEKAVDKVNCQVRMYDRGAIIFPYDKNYKPLTCYTEKQFGGESCNEYSEGHSGGYMKTLTDANLNNKIKSFKLKRGYMVTFALGQSGWGYSRVYIADQEDLEVDLPANMSGHVSSYRLFKWWNAHKAGLASDGRKEANAAVGSCWCYDWGQGNSSLLPDVEWVPNHIYEDWPSSATCGSVDGSCHMKTNNEPGNSADDHPQSVETILDNWQNLMRTGMRLCSESSHDGSWNHLKEFIKEIDARGWRCDLLDLHCYWPAGSFGDFKNYYNDYGGRPIWISEWVWGASWNNNGAFAVSNRNDFNGNQNNTYNGTVPILEKLNAAKYVERYAYWNSEADCSKIYKDGQLSKLGKYYAEMDEGLGYDPTIQKVPNVVYQTPNNVKLTYNKSKGTATLTWDDANGDMLDSLVVQYKAPGTTAWRWKANIPLKDANSKSGSSYTFTATDIQPGANYYRIAAYPIGNKTPRTSEEVSCTASSSLGTDMYQYGKISVTNLTPIVTEFSEQFSTMPAVFMGVISNKSTKFYPGNLLTSVTKTKFTYQVLPGTKQTGGSTEVEKEEDIPFLALQDTTSYKFGELDCKVGNIKVNMKDTLEVNFRTPFPEGVTPIVIAELRNSSLKTDPICIRIWDVTNKGFKTITRYETGVGKTASTNLTVCYLAITPGLGVLDAENEILIGAGHGDNIYGTTARATSFMNGEETLYFKSPLIFGALQTLRYDIGSVIRRMSDTTETDKESPFYGLTSGTRIKRIVDKSATNYSSTTDSNKEYGDEFGWVVIAKVDENGSTPTSIEEIVRNYNAKNTINVKVADGMISVPGNNCEVFSASGSKVAPNTKLAPGIYIVKCGKDSAKVLIK